MDMIFSIAVALIVFLVLAIVLAPRRVRYVEDIVIEASAAEIYDHIRFQERLMRWSAWPAATGSICSLEGQDGQVGARTVFLDRAGRRFGHQEVTALASGRSVALSLTAKGPPQRPLLRFEIEPVAPGRSRVLLHFDNAITPPFNVILHLAGIVRWTRRLHRKDLEGLKDFAERLRAA